MEKRRRRKFTNEYKEDVIRMLEEKEIPIKELAKDMGLGIDLLYSWRRRYGKGNSNISKEENTAEVKKLIKRLREVEEERDILKKAMAIFTQPTKPGMGS
jgi:transposase-like protein